jgi:hypothetical protein
LDHDPTTPHLFGTILRRRHASALTLLLPRRPHDRANAAASATSPVTNTLDAA